MFFKLPESVMFFRERGHLSLQEKGAIIALLHRGVSVNEVAEICGCHPTTVRRWMHRYEETCRKTIWFRQAKKNYAGRGYDAARRGPRSDECGRVFVNPLADFRQND